MPVTHGWSRGKPQFVRRLHVIERDATPKFSLACPRYRSYFQCYTAVVQDVDTFERAAGVFVNDINAMLEDYVPRARESLYAKRWWSKDLMLLRRDYNFKRNRITTLRRRGECTIRAREASHTARRVYLDEIDEQKKQRWKDFLNDRNNI